MNRRHFLSGIAASTAGLCLPSVAEACVLRRTRRSGCVVSPPTCFPNDAGRGEELESGSEFAARFYYGGYGPRINYKFEASFSGYAFPSRVAVYQLNTFEGRWDWKKVTQTRWSKGYPYEDSDTVSFESELAGVNLVTAWFNNPSIPNILNPENGWQYYYTHIIQPTLAADKLSQHGEFWFGTRGQTAVRVRYTARTIK